MYIEVRPEEYELITTNSDYSGIGAGYFKTEDELSKGIERILDEYVKKSSRTSMTLFTGKNPVRYEGELLKTEDGWCLAESGRVVLDNLPKTLASREFRKVEIELYK